MHIAFRTLLLMGVLVAGAAIAAEFVPGVAANDAGRIADADSKKFFAMYIPAGTSPESILPDIETNLRDGARAKAQMAIIGPDFDLNAKLVKTALRRVPRGALAGLTILLVNGGEDSADILAEAASAGAVFRATKYSGTP